MDTTVSPAAVVMPAAAIEAQAWVPLGPMEGVTHRVLWQDGTSMAGVLRIEAGRRLGLHTHRVNDHHIWVLEGRAEILGHVLGPGSYVYEPSGVEHDIDASATEGCTVFYLYVRQAG
ncbi:MAG TPA: cupin domain-containing protein [Acidimicrobiales bacterium]|nr:cupin domain-containing protein [Acidimicrobiales bacterium]